jgi:hypothetical protein
MCPKKILFVGEKDNVCGVTDESRAIGAVDVNKSAPLVQSKSTERLKDSRPNRFDIVWLERRLGRQWFNMMTVSISS